MTVSDFYARVLMPAHAFLRTVNPRLASAEAACMLLATAGQETQWNARRQLNGPARGFWQGEPNGVLAVRENPATGRDVTNAARALCIGIDRASIYLAIEYCDPLAYVVARLLLWCVPEPLPALGDEAEAWRQYCEAQRPGKPDRERWAEVYPQAVAVVGAATVPSLPPQQGERTSA